MRDSRTSTAARSWEKSPVVEATGVCPADGVTGWDTASVGFDSDSSGGAPESEAATGFALAAAEAALVAALLFASEALPSPIAAPAFVAAFGGIGPTFSTK